MLIASLYNYKIHNPESQIAVVSDELQNQILGESSAIAKIMREGRKLHLAMVGATQLYRTSGDPVANVMRLAETRMFLKPTPDSEKFVADTLRWDKKESQYFERMERGDCIVSGQMYNHIKGRNCQVVLRGKVCTFKPIPDWKKRK